MDETQAGRGRHDHAFEAAVYVFMLGLAATMFFSQSGLSLFGPLACLALVLWRLSGGKRPWPRLPYHLGLSSAAFAAVFLISAAMSEDKAEGFSHMKTLWNMLFCWLLFAAPMAHEKRVAVIAVFLAAASAAGLMGVLQYFEIFLKPIAGRAHGTGHPIHYAIMLSLACSASLAGAVIPNRFFPATRKVRALLLICFALTATGVLLSQSRGVWIALAVALLVTLLIYDRRKAAAFALAMCVAVGLVFMVSAPLRARLATAVTALYSDSDQGSTATRFQLWRGALIIFSEHPVIGTGAGDFDEDIDRMASEGAIGQPLVEMHAHNVFLHWLATQGALGGAALIYLLCAIFAWGASEIRRTRTFGGYVIVMSTLVIAVGGLTEMTIMISKIITAYSATVGIFGGAADS